MKKSYFKQTLFIICPLMVVVVYLFAFAVEKYSSDASFVISDLSVKKNPGFDLGIFGSTSSSAQLDVNIVKEFLHSLDMLKQVDSRFDLKKYYQSSKTDILERLFNYSTEEDFLALYRKNLKIVHDDLAGITRIGFTISDRQLSKQILEFLLENGQDFLNALNHQRAEKKIAFAATQLQRNKAKLDQGIIEMEAFQNLHRLVDPATDVAVQSNIIATLEASMVEKTSEYNQLLSFMAPSAIEVERIGKQIQEIKSALDVAKNRLSGQEKEQLNRLFFDFEKLKSDVDFAKEVYKNTLVQYEINKIETMQQSKVFEVITAPSLPDGYVYPNRFKAIGMALFFILVFYKIAGLVWAVVQDHKD
jgi:capsular polysaccharide transport system permease protein